MVDIQDSIVTIDTIGCQQEIAQQIRQQGADYLLALKENRPPYNDVVSIFKKATEGEKKFKKRLHLCKVERIKAHGRLER